MNPGAPELPRQRGERWWRAFALVAVLAAAFLLRLFFGWPTPTAARQGDERYSLENAEALLRTRTFHPVNGFHPSLSFVPQSLVLAALEACECVDLGTGTKKVLRPRENWDPDHPPRLKRSSGMLPSPRLTPLAYRSCRIFQAMLGVLTVALTYFLGQRLFSPAAGWVAAWLTAFAPWSIWAGGTCNEDAGFALAFLGALSVTVWCVSRPALGRFLVLGVVYGLALSTKFNAAPIALPIVAWVAWHWREWRVLLLRLGLAGVVALATFLLLNIHFVLRPQLLDSDFGQTMSNYAQKSRAQMRTRTEIAASALVSPVEWNFFGPLAGGVALFGWTLWFAVRRKEGEALEARAMVPGFLLSYAGLYALATGNLSTHNWIPLIPIYSLPVGLCVSEVCRRSRFLPPQWARPARVAVLAAAGALLWVPTETGIRFVYDGVLHGGLHRRSAAVPAPSPDPKGQRPGA